MEPERERGGGRAELLETDIAKPPELALATLDKPSFFEFSVCARLRAFVSGAVASAGVAYAFTSNATGSTWTQQAKIISSEPETDEAFGESVAYASNTAVIGAPLRGLAGAPRGAAYVFARFSGVWSQTAAFSPPSNGPNVGRSVAISGNWIVVGEASPATFGGQAVVHIRGNGDWSTNVTIPTPGSAADEQVGYAVAISGSTIAVGANVDNLPGFINAGSVYLSEISTPTAASFSEHPADAAICPMGDVTLNVTVAGSTPITIAWEVETEVPGVFTPLVANGTIPGVGTISGVDTQSLTVNMPLFSDFKRFRCVASNSCGSVTSSIATLDSACAVCPAWLQWQGIAGVNDRVSAIAVLPGGDVIVGGEFTTAGGVAASRLARYNPTTGAWSALGSGTAGTVFALAVLPGGDVIVGGFFTTVGGVPARNIARYNPTTSVWSALGSGTSGVVYSLAVLPGGDLIVGGLFGSAGQTSASSIARYNPTTGTWSALGSGLNSGATELAVLPSGELIVGGAFSTAGGVQAFNIARYDPITGTWSALGSGVNGTVHALTVLPDGDLVVGGFISSAGGVSVSRIARYNPTTGVWSALGSGTNDVVWALAVRPGGYLVAGGKFTDAGGGAANRIARYDLDTGIWSALGSGVDDEVHALAVLQGGDLVAGGWFELAGDIPTGSFARYAFGEPAPTIFSQPTPEAACAAGSATFAVTADGTGTLNYRWQYAEDAAMPLMWNDLTDGAWVYAGQERALISGASTPSLGLAELYAGPDFNTVHVPVLVRCIVTNACGSETSDAALLTMRCPTDFECNGTVDVGDLFGFLDAWFAQSGVCMADCTADFDGNNTVDVVDLFGFLDAWFAQNGVCGP